MARVVPVLTRESWLEAGQALMSVAGIRGVKLQPLAKSLNISTGSFYHHFRDFDEFLGELAIYYGREQVHSALSQILSTTDDPAERLALVSRFAVERGMPVITVAMRAWAQSDPRAKKAVDEVQEFVSGILIENYLLLGFTRKEAELCAFLLVAAGGVALPLPGWVERREQLSELVIETFQKASGRLPPQPL